jgi:hypothetical protein
MNSPEINAKITHRTGLARQWADSPRSMDQLIEEAYLTVLARRPRPSELDIARQAFQPQLADPPVASAPAAANTAAPNTAASNAEGPAAESRQRREAVEDILWTLLNSKEFLYVH